MKSLLMIAGVLACGLLAACGDDDFSLPPPHDVYFAIVDASGDPLPNAFVGVVNRFSNAAQSRTAFTDPQGNTCIDPDSNEPMLTNGELTSAGCTDENGMVKVTIDLNLAGINCANFALGQNVDLFIKAEDGTTAFAAETCHFLYDNSDADHPEHLQVYGLDF